jgi:hypothetical protein
MGKQSPCQTGRREEGDGRREEGGGRREEGDVWNAEPDRGVVGNLEDE